MKKQQNIDWIFFDVGGVLMDDSESEEWRKNMVLDVLKEYDAAFTRKEIDEAFYRGSSFVGNTDANIIKVLVKEEKICQKLIEEAKKRRSLRWSTMKEFSERSHFTEGIKEVIEELSKYYNLGIIANQPHEINDRLEKEGLLQYFKNVGLSAEKGLHKPDPLLFKQILEESGALAEKSVMIDDNIERGLAPARNLGMKTVLFDWGYRAEYPEWINFKIKKATDLLDIF